MHDVREFHHSQGLDYHTLGAENHEFVAMAHPDGWPLHEFMQEGNTAAPQYDSVNDVTLHFAAAQVPLPRHRHRHRKVPKEETPRPRPTRGELVSLVTVTSTVVIVAAVCALGGTVTHDPLRNLAGADASQGLADWWPLLVYGPWMVASLSILRAAVYQRRAPHSWCVVLLFSALAIILCVDQAPRTVTSAMVASLPTVAMVSCFHQLVRQITLTRPPRRGVASQRPSSQDVRP